MDKIEMDRISQGLESKAAKARALFQAGVSTGDIGRYLDIRYQHVYNVLLRAGLIEKSAIRGTASSNMDGDSDVVVAQIETDGRLALPDNIMKRYGLIPGSMIYGRVLEEGLLILSHEAALEHVTSLVRDKMPEQAALIEALLRRKPDTPSGSP